MQYYLVYQLGLPNPPGKKTVRGTMGHSVFEALAHCKKCIQENRPIKFEHGFGPIETDESSLYTRGFVDELVERSFQHYTKQESHISFTKADHNELNKVIHRGLELHNGCFDPRNRHILEPETYFEFEIREDWAKYDYEVDGERLSGYLTIKGTIDLTTVLDNTTLEITDYKLGKAWNWKLNKQKEFNDFQNDPQLHMYHWAISKMYPQYDMVLMTIFYMSHDLSYTMAYNKDDLKKTEDMLRKQFESVRACKYPKLLNTFFCHRVCSFGKNDISALIPGRSGKTICEFIHNEIRTKGIDTVTKLYMAEGHKMGKYSNPGS